jgi:hypothetical protein
MALVDRVEADSQAAVAGARPLLPCIVNAGLTANVGVARL